MKCIFCGSKFCSSIEDDNVCTTCERAIKQLGLNMRPDRIKELAQADRAGRLVVLPCKVGEKVWLLSETGEPYKARVHGISVSATGEDTLLKFGPHSPFIIWGSDKGKSWFQTRQEAEKAAGRKEKPT